MKRYTFPASEGTQHVRINWFPLAEDWTPYSGSCFPSTSIHAEKLSTVGIDQSGREHLKLEGERLESRRDPSQLVELQKKLGAKSTCHGVAFQWRSADTRIAAFRKYPRRGPSQIRKTRTADHWSNLAVEIDYSSRRLSYIHVSCWGWRRWHNLGKSNEHRVLII